jgi:hypothetical protein
VPVRRLGGEGFIDCQSEPDGYVVTNHSCEQVSRRCDRGAGGVADIWRSSRPRRQQCPAAGSSLTRPVRRYPVADGSDQRDGFEPLNADVAPRISSSRRSVCMVSFFRLSERIL